jgi:hypothetical protein
MARVATAYVEIRPDLSGFAKELKAKLAAMKESMVVNLKPDMRGLTKAMTSAKSKTAVNKAGRVIGEELAESIQDEFGQVGMIDDRDMTDQSRRLARIVTTELGREAPRSAEVWTQGFASWLDKRFKDEVMRPLRSLADEEKLNGRLAAEEFIEGYRQHFKDEEGRLLPIDKGLLQRLERDLVVAIGPVGTSVAKAFTTSLQRDWDRMVAQAYRDNTAFNQAVAKAKREWNAIVADAYADHKRFVANQVRDAKKDMDAVIKEAYGDNKAFDDAVKRGKVDFDRAFSGAWGNNRAITKATSDAADFAANAATREFGSAMSAVSNGISKLIVNPIGAALITAVVGWGTIFVGALIGSIAFALAGVGTLGVAGFLLKDESAVRKAASDLGTTFMKSFQDAVRPAMGTLIEALDIVTDALPRLAGKFGQLVFGIRSGFKDLAKGAVGFTDALFDGLNKGMPGIRLALEELGDFLPKLGKKLGDLFADIDPRKLQLTLRGMLTLILVLTDAMVSTIDVAVNLLGWIAEGGVAARRLWDFIFEVARQLTAPIRATFLEDIKPKVDAVISALQPLVKAIDFITPEVPPVFKLDADLGDADSALDQFGGKLSHQAESWAIFQQSGQDAFAGLSESTSAAVEEIDTLITKMDFLDDAFIDAEEAEARFLEINDKVAKQIKDGKKSWDENTDAGRDNQKMIRDQAKSVESRIQAELRNGMSLKDSLKLFNDQREAIIANAIELGASETAAKEYADQLGLTPKDLLVKAAMQGVPGALEELQKITGDKDVKVKPSADTESMADVADFLVFSASDAGKEAGLTFDEYMASGIKDGAPVVKAAGSGAGSEVAKGVQEMQTKVKAAGTIIANKAGEGVRAAYSGAKTVGSTLGGMVATGLTSASGVVRGAGTTLGNAAKAGLAGVSFVSNGISMALSLAAGLVSGTAKGAMRAATDTLVAIFKAGVPNSPKAKVGPLSGSGDSFYSGRTIAQHLADGMMAGSSAVASASQALASQIKTPFASVGTLGGISEMAAPAVNVYIGPERLDARIDYRVSSTNDDMARALLSGRSGL